MLFLDADVEDQCTRVYNTIMTRIREMMFSHTPALTICLMVTSPEPKATALEGVATGSM